MVGAWARMPHHPGSSRSFPDDGASVPALPVALLSIGAASKTLFQKIMDREEPGETLYEDDLCVALRDINPQAPTHVLIVPRKPIPNLDALTEEDEPLVGHLFVVAQRVAADEGLA